MARLLAKRFLTYISTLFQDSMVMFLIQEAGYVGSFQKKLIIGLIANHALPSSNTR